ncbi:hypothetical protein ZWY2020_057264 [Hordeum vulgare]|nr:hypothetical protein ZWY2020_057264 [Hordeum vulgare]
MDSRLEGQYHARGAFRAAQLTLKCLAGEPKSRPSMKEVVEALEQIEAMKSKSKSREARRDSPSMARGRGNSPRSDGSRTNSRGR